jgi:hypothetical protein
MSEKIEEYLTKFFEKVPDEDKAAMAGFIMGHVALEGTDNYMESLGLFEIAKDQFKKSYEDVENEENDRDKIIRMN